MKEFEDAHRRVTAQSFLWETGQVHVQQGEEGFISKKLRVTRGALRVDGGRGLEKGGRTTRGPNALVSPKSRELGLQNGG